MTDLTPERLKAIAAAAKKATPGPWEAHAASYGWDVWSNTPTEFRTWVGPVQKLCNPHSAPFEGAIEADSAFCAANATHIANCDPQTITAMVTELLALRGQIGDVLAREAETTARHDARVEAVERENTRLRQALRPFSEAEEYVGDRMPDENGCVMLTAIGLNIGDIRRARAFLANMEEK